MAPPNSDSHATARRTKGEFFDKDMKKDISDIGPDWLALPEARRNKDRSTFFNKHFKDFREKYEHKFHPDDRTLLEKVSLLVPQYNMEYL